LDRNDGIKVSEVALIVVVLLVDDSLVLVRNFGIEVAWLLIGADTTSVGTCSRGVIIVAR
jgi:hypothetical protein